MEPKLVRGSEGTERCPVFMGPRVDHFVCFVGKLNNMLLYLKIMLICDCVMY